MNDKERFEKFLKLLPEQTVDNLVNYWLWNAYYPPEEINELLFNYEAYSREILSNFSNKQINKTWKRFNKEFYNLTNFLFKNFDYKVGIIPKFVYFKPILKAEKINKWLKNKKNQLDVTLNNFEKEYKSFLITTQKELSENNVRDDSKKDKFVIPIKPKETIGWDRISIKFKNKSDFEIKAGNKKYNYTYEMMGFSDKRIKDNKSKIKTNGAREFLDLLAIGGGKFLIGSLFGKDKTKRMKQKQFLTKILKNLFPTVSGDPFEDYNDKENVYKIKIHLIPMKEFRKDFRDKDIHDESEDIKSFFDEQVKGK